MSAVLNKALSGILFFLFLSGTEAKADDLTTDSPHWLTLFLNDGLSHLRAGYSIDHQEESSGTDEFSKIERFDVYLSFDSKEYRLDYFFEYQDKWDVLTNKGKVDPPEMIPAFAGSRQSYWSNYNGVGTYSEEFQRIIPNWMHLNKLETNLQTIIRLGNPLPSISGLFNKDELKLIKSVYCKAAKGKMESDAGWWQNFEYDAKGNVTGLDQSYYESLTKSDDIIKDVKSIEYQLYNKKSDYLKIEPVRGEDSLTLVDGIKVSMDQNVLVIFNFELNAMLCRFTPELIRSPENVVTAFLKNLANDCNADLERFADN